MPDYQGARRRVPLRERMDSILGRLPETTRTAMSPLLGGPQGVGILDVLPGTGEALAANDYVDAREAGDSLGQGIAALGVVPVVGAAGRGVGRGARAARAAAKAPRIRAYHGSPYEFDRFDLSKIGTGEGAQAYGHGLYLAEAEDTGRFYRDALFAKALRMNGPNFRSVGRLKLVPELAAKDIAMRGLPAAQERLAAIDDALSFIARYPGSNGDAATRHYMAERDEILRLVQTGDFFVPRGHMYEVDILASPDELLDWDVPLSQQSEAVRDAVNRVGRLPGSPLDRVPDDLRGRSLLPLVSRPDMVSELNRAGVPGIRYLDGNSRAAGEGSHNYVVFDADRIEILRRYGLLPPAMLATQQAMQDRQPPRRQEPPRRQRSPTLDDMQRQLQQMSY